MIRLSRNRQTIGLWIGLWAVSVAAGYHGLMAYHGTPGSAGSPPRLWPGATELVLDGTRPSLLLFIHPRCPCTKASLAELARLAARFPDEMTIQVVSYTPDPSTAEWDRIARSSLTTVPGARHVLDRGGREAERFGVRTSGHGLLFDPSGRLRFSGGITLSRGHEGPNPGVDRLAEAIDDAKPGAWSSPVFGCPFEKSRNDNPPEAKR